MRDRGAKGRHDGVADKLVDLTAVVGDGLVKDLEAAVDGSDELFRWQHLGQAREAADVGEQNGDWAQVAFDRAQIAEMLRRTL